MRDLKRANAKEPAYISLPKLGFETFTPMHWVLNKSASGATKREYKPFIHGLLFVKSLKKDLDPTVAKTPTLQYTFVKGSRQTPLVVPTSEMELFINAVSAEHSACVYYSPEDIKPEMLGKRVKIVGGVMDGAVGNLLKLQGSRRKRLVVNLKDMLVASVEITDGFVELL